MIGRALLLATLLALPGAAPEETWSFAVVGLTQDYLEPCGCGGQDAGGLARRAAMLAAARRVHRNLVVIEAGDLGVLADRTPLIVRAIAHGGAAACALSGDDLAAFARLAPLAAASGLPLTSAVPPAGGEVAPYVVIGSQGGPPAGLVSLAWRELSVREMASRYQEAASALRAGGCGLLLLVSHLGTSGTAEVLELVPAALRPRVVLLATAADLTLPAFNQLGATWVPLARRGRSLSLLTARRRGEAIEVEVEQQMVYRGEVDLRVQRWVEEYHAAARAGQVVTSPPAEPPPPLRPATCLPCHEPAVRGWRQHAHARAVETLEKIGRDVAACLPCHAESFRREGLRPPPSGDRGVTCASCHGRVAEHLAEPARLPVAPNPALCASCHTAESSPHWDEPRYWAHMAAACRGETPGPLPRGEH